MQRLTIAVVLWTNTALAHDGHGASAGHLHGLEFGLLAALVVAAAIYILRRKL